MNRIYLALGIGLLAGGGLVACGSTGHQDAPVGEENHAPARTIDFPSGFRNIAAKCDGNNMVYSVSSAQSDSLSGGVAVVPNDSRCKP